MKTRSGIVTLCTDFGLSDPYVGQMKGAILSINPRARLIDISHQIGAGAIDQAARTIHESHAYFPGGTVHVVVVDPGVGSERRPLAVQADDHIFVGPDNGVFGPVIKASKTSRVVHLSEKKYFRPEISRTFHGRDIFAPAAAHLALGLDPEMMGPATSDPVTLELPVPYEKGDALHGRVVRVDNFGNIITDIRYEVLDAFLRSKRPVIELGDMVIDGLGEAYANAGIGQPLALIDSTDCLEIAVNQGRAVDVVGIDPEKIIGSTIKVRRGRGI